MAHRGGRRFCPNCKKVGRTRVDPADYTQTEYKGIPVKRRKIMHTVDDGETIGCGHTWFTIEIPEELLIE